MIRNDYRRAMIMLRALEGDASGFVRLERRTLRGTLQFTVNGAPEGELRAAMLGNIQGWWRAVDLGALRRDARGQAGMTFTYDPRNIAGYDLDDYAMLGVVGRIGDGWRLMMTGWVAGSKVVDWAAVNAAVAAQYSPGGAQTAQGAETASAGSEGAQGGSAARAAAPEAPSQAGASMAARRGASTTVHSRTSTETQGGASPAALTESPQDAPPEAYAAYPADLQPSMPDAALSESAQEEPDTPEPVTALPGAFEAEAASLSAGASAMERLPVALASEWPAQLMPIRELFITQPLYEGIEMEGYVFVRAPMPSVSEQAYCAVGIMAQGDRIMRTCYAIPGQYASQPPAGLEGYVFMQGAEGGWWVVCHDAA